MSAENQARTGVDLAIDQICWIRERGWSGLYLMSPSPHEPGIDVRRRGLA